MSKSRFSRVCGQLLALDYEAHSLGNARWRYQGMHLHRQHSPAAFFDFSQRVRVLGRRLPTVHPLAFADPIEVQTTQIEDNCMPLSHSQQLSTVATGERIIPAVPLTHETFAPFGDVVQAWANPLSAPRGIRVTSANQNTAHKFHKLSTVVSSYPSDVVTGPPRVSVFRSTPPARLAVPVPQEVDMFEVKLLERHRHTNQLFIPMGTGATRSVEHDILPVAARAYLVIVAQNGAGNGFFVRIFIRLGSRLL